MKSKNFEPGVQLFENVCTVFSPFSTCKYSCKSVNLNLFCQSFALNKFVEFFFLFLPACFFRKKIFRFFFASILSSIISFIQQIQKKKLCNNFICATNLTPNKEISFKIYLISFFCENKIGKLKPIFCYNMTKKKRSDNKPNPEILLLPI